MKTMRTRFTPPLTILDDDKGAPTDGGNPLFRLLPPILSNEEWRTLLASAPDFTEEERLLSADHRMHRVMELKKVFVVQARHLELREKIELLVRHGYAGMSVDRAGDRVKLQSRYEALQRGDIEAAHTKAVSSAECFTLVGMSGVGKSFTAERIFNYFAHAGESKKFGFTQIPVLVIQCPHRKSTRHVALAILQAIDERIGTSYYREFRRLNEDDLILEIANLLDYYFVGLLVLDELQNISTKKSGGQEEFMNFFLLLINKVRRPMMFIGTMKAIKVLQQTFRLARRHSGFGTIIWRNLPYGREWERLVRELLKYQWVRTPVPYSEALSKKLYEWTQGLPSLLVSLLMLAQIRAIRLEGSGIEPADGAPLLNERLIDAVAADNFSALAPMLKAIRSGDDAKMAKYEDLIFPTIDDMAAIEGRWARTDLGETLDEKTMKFRHDGVARRAHQALSELNIPQAVVEAQIASILQENPFAASDEIVVEVLARLNGPKGTRPKKPKKSGGKGDAKDPEEPDSAGDGEDDGKGQNNPFGDDAEEDGGGDSGEPPHET